MSFEAQFSEVLHGGEDILCRLSSDPKYVSKTIDILRVMIECRLLPKETEISKTELASALILFKEIYPNNTDAKLAVLTSLRDRIIEVAEAFSVETEEDVAFYDSHVGIKRSELHSLIMGVIDCVHFEWSEQHKVEIKLARDKEKWGPIADLCAGLGGVAYFGLSLLFCYILSGKFLSWHLLALIVPGFGQLYFIGMMHYKFGFGMGAASFFAILFIGAICFVFNEFFESKLNPPKP